MATCQDVRAVRCGRRWRWECPGCGERGPERSKARAEDGAGYHAYAARPMTVAEFVTMGDGMNRDVPAAEALERVQAFNESAGKCLSQR